MKNSKKQDFSTKRFTVARPTNEALKYCRSRGWRQDSGIRKMAVKGVIFNQEKTIIGSWTLSAVLGRDGQQRGGQWRGRWMGANGGGGTVPRIAYTARDSYCHSTLQLLYCTSWTPAWYLGRADISLMRKKMVWFKYFISTHIALYYCALLCIILCWYCRCFRRCRNCFLTQHLH